MTHPSKKVFSRSLFFLLFIWFDLIFFGCTSTSVQNSKLSESDTQILLEEELSCLNWQQLAPGINWTKVHNFQIPVIFHIVKINLDTPGLTLNLYPGSKAFKPSWTDPQNNTVRGIKGITFAEKTNSVVTVNTTPYERNSILKRKPSGINFSEGIQYAPARFRYSALAFYSDSKNHLRAKIIYSQSEKLEPETKAVSGAFFTILKNGEIQPFKTDIFDSRTAAAVNEDGSVLWLLVAEGEHKNKSRGLSYPECAFIFKTLGAREALEFDGGSSTSFFINNHNALSYASLLHNSSWLGFSISSN